MAAGGSRGRGGGPSKRMVAEMHRLEMDPQGDVPSILNPVHSRLYCVVRFEDGSYDIVVMGWLFLIKDKDGKDVK